MLFALVILFKIVLTFIILRIKMSIFKNLIYLPLNLITICSCLPNFPWWLQVIYFHLLIANEISLTFLHETLKGYHSVLNSFPSLWQLYAQWGIVKGWISRWYINPTSSRRNRSPVVFLTVRIMSIPIFIPLTFLYFTLVEFTPFRIFSTLFTSQYLLIEWGIWV